MRGYGRQKRDLRDFGDLFYPSEAAEPILPKAIRNALLEWLTEIWAEKDLEAVGIGPRRKAMFNGPPGVGKTTLAHHLAARLGLPMIAVRPDLVISKWVGETGQNIGQLFEAAARGLDEEDGTTTPIVLFIDEFDAISRQRRKGEQASDDSRNEEVNTLLQRIEQHSGFLIAATNFAGHVDKAAWRRFDIHITLELPGQFERERIIARYLEPFGLPRIALKSMGEAFDSASPALIRQFCENLKRQIIVGPKIGWNMQREAVVERLLASVQPHPEIGTPRLWSLGAKDVAVKNMPWPLPRADEIVEVDGSCDEPTSNVVHLAG